MLDKSIITIAKDKLVKLLQKIRGRLTSGVDDETHERLQQGYFQHSELQISTSTCDTDVDTLDKHQRPP